MKDVKIIIIICLALIYRHISAQNTIPLKWGNALELPRSAGTSSARGSVGFTACIDKYGVITNIYNDEFPVGSGSKIRITRTSDYFNTYTDYQLPPATKTIGNYGPNIACDTMGNLHVIWAATLPAAVYYARYDRATGIWSDTIRISDTIRYKPQDPTLTVDLKLRVHVMWHDGDPTTGAISTVNYVQSPDGGFTWHDQKVISTFDGKPSAFPRSDMSAVKGDTLAIVWRKFINLDRKWDIVLGLSLDGGMTWRDTVIVADTGTQSDPGIIIDNNYNFHINFHEYPPGDFEGARILAGKSEDLGKTWTPSGFMKISPDFRSHLTTYNYDRHNDVIWVFWKDERPLPGGDRKQDIACSYSIDKGLTYSKPEFITNRGVGLKSTFVDKEGTPYIVFDDVVDTSIGRSAQFIKKRITIFPERMPVSYTTLHIDPLGISGRWWPYLVEMVDSANVYQVPLTLEFHPVWADTALSKSSYLDQLRLWESQGHEVAFHHHGFDHDGVRDGFTNEVNDAASYGQDANDAPYRGDMDDYWALMINLQGDSIITTGGISDWDTDWPVRLPYQSYGDYPGDFVGAVERVTITGIRTVCRIPYHFVEDTATLHDLLRSEYPLATADSVVGFVTHPQNYINSPLFYIEWLRFISGRNTLNAKQIIRKHKCDPLDCYEITSASVSRITPTSARIKWDTVPNASGYIIRGGVVGNPNMVTIMIQGQVNYKDIYGLKNNTQYWFEIAAICKDPAMVFPPPPPYWLPDTFTTGCQITDSLWAGPVTVTAARLNWKRVTGAAGYEIRGRKAGSNWINLLVGSGNTTYKDIFNLQPNSQYHWRVRTWCDPNGVVKSPYSAIDTFNTPGTRMGLFESGEMAVNVYPNPVNERLYLSLDGEKGHEYQVLLRDLTGRLVYSTHVFSPGLNVIEVNHLEDGIYWLEMKSAAKYWSARVMICH